VGNHRGVSIQFFRNKSAEAFTSSGNKSVEASIFVRNESWVATGGPRLNDLGISQLIPLSSLGISRWEPQGNFLNMS
jgi:hypothetical protein